MAIVRKLKLEGGATGLFGAGDSGSLRGQQGETGLMGSSGMKGDRGSTGPHGLRGQQGDTGVAGIKGETGFTLGVRGLTGFDGITGSDGQQGLTGFDGADGATGPAGPAGADLTEDLTLTAADLAANSPVTIVEAPGAGKYISLNRVVAKLGVNSAPYPSTSGVGVKAGNSLGYFLDIPNFLTKTPNGYSMACSVGTQYLKENEALKILPYTEFYPRLGVNFASASGTSPIAFSSSGVPYVACVVSTQCQVWAYIGSVWARVGANFAVATGNPSIAINSSGVPYVSVSVSGQAQLWYYDTVGSVWTRVGANFATSSASTSLAFNSSDIPYVTCNVTGHAEVWKYDGGWAKVGGDVTCYSTPTIAINSIGVPYIAVTDNNIGSVSQIQVWYYDGDLSAWTRVGADFAANTYLTSLIPMIAINSGVPYISCNIYGQIQVWYYDGSVWVKVGGDVAASTVSPIIAFNSSGVPYVSLYYIPSGASTGKIQVWSYSDNIWKQSADIVTTTSTGSYIAINASNIYVSALVSGQVQVFKKDLAVYDTTALLKAYYEILDVL
jgi:glutaredoxin